MRTSVVSIARVFDFAIFPKNCKILICVSVSVCVCVCACALCLCAPVCVCMYECEKWKKCFNCHMHNTIYVFIFEMWRNFKSLWIENFKNLLLIYITQTFTSLKFRYISSSIKIFYTLKKSWKRIFIEISFYVFHAKW